MTVTPPYTVQHSGQCPGRHELQILGFVLDRNGLSIRRTALHYKRLTRHNWLCFTYQKVRCLQFYPEAATVTTRVSALLPVHLVTGDVEKPWRFILYRQHCEFRLKGNRSGESLDSVATKTFGATTVCVESSAYSRTRRWYFSHTAPWQGDSRQPD